MDEEKKPKIVTWEILEYYHAKVKAAFVGKETGKGLSTNDFTDALKEKLEGLSGDEYVTQEDIDSLFDDNEANNAGAGEDTVSGDGGSLDGNT